MFAEPGLPELNAISATGEHRLRAPNGAEDTLRGTLSDTSEM
jgi:hypothetical protein